MSIAHVSKYPENDNAGLEPIHSSLGDIRGVERGEDGKTEGCKTEGRLHMKREEGRKQIECRRSGNCANTYR